MSKQLDGKRIAILATDGFEQVELTEPRKALDEAGAGMRVLEVKADRSSLRQLHAAIKAAL